MRLATIISIILALTTTAAAGATMYKWTDADGGTQYG